MFRPQVFADILPEPVHGRCRVIRPVQMIVQQEMDCADVLHFESLNQLPVVFRTKELLDFINREEGSQPFPFIIIANEKPDVTIARLVSRSAQNSPAQWTFDSWSEIFQRNRVLSFIRPLSSLVELARWRWWNIESFPGC